MELFEKLEKLRRIILVTTLLAFLIFVTGFVCLASLDEGVPALILFAVCMLLSVGAILLIGRTVTSYKRLFKENLVRTMLEGFFDEIVYDPKGGIEEEVIRDTEMIAMGNIFCTNDYLEGCYNGTHFRQSDVAIRQSVPMGKTVSTVTYFDGRWMIFDMKRPFLTELLVKEKSFMKHQTPIGKGKGFQPIAVEGEDFNRFFRVYAVAPDKAAYILTDRMRKAILDLNYSLRGDLIFLFSGNRLHIAYHGVKDSFEPPVLRKPDRDALEKLVRADIALIITFVEALVLDTALFLQEEATKEEQEEEAAAMPLAT